MAGDRMTDAEIIKIIREELDWPVEEDPDGAVLHALGRIAERIIALRSSSTGRSGEAEAMRERAAACADQWSRPSAVKLSVGEMTAGELRVAQAVAKGVSAAIRALPTGDRTDG